jgi:DmsE family decaheme c-type cytochrome
VQCHRKEVNKVHKSSHMPVGEFNGTKMECTTCHNPHGSQNVKMLKEGTSVTEACATCHAEKRGPFLWEHNVGRESCVTCHDAHGSNNERMLVAKVPMLCQRCHIHSRHPATIYDSTQIVTNKSDRAAGPAWLNSQQMIHGSNHPTSGKVFMR